CRASPALGEFVALLTCAAHVGDPFPDRLGPQRLEHLPVRFVELFVDGVVDDGVVSGTSRQNDRPLELRSAQQLVRLFDFVLAGASSQEWDQGNDSSPQNYSFP